MKPSSAAWCCESEAFIPVHPILPNMVRETRSDSRDRMSPSDSEVRDTVTVEEQWGALLAKAYDDAGTQTNHWFHETTDGEWMHHSEVIHYTGPEGSHKRHFVKEGEIMLPDAVRQAVEAEGYTVEEEQ